MASAPTGGRAVVLERLAHLDPGTYRPHALHDDTRIWSETNCYADVWIEVLHALGLEPLAAAAYCLSVDFEGTQWSFFKPPAADLRRLYGTEVAEMNVWRAVLDHVEEELVLGRLLTVEVDSWWLPDTRGNAYREAHVKTTIVPQLVDRERRVLRYFHGQGYHELSEGDFEGVFGPSPLPPYIELVRLDDRPADDDHQLQTALSLARDHLSRRPADNPVRRLGAHLDRTVEWLSAQDLATFHQFAFGTCRQLGASAELAASHLAWLGAHAGVDLEGAAGALLDVAEGAKALQFTLARAARGRAVDLPAAIEPLAATWDVGLGAAAEVIGDV